MHEHEWIDFTRLGDRERRYVCVKCGASGQEVDMYQGWSDVLVDANTEPHDAATVTLRRQS
jgi:hypothetical protein